jgi:dinuclear metal center YbgI/SA1388 family protein
MVKIKEVSDYLESIAPRSLQESYDNSGLLVGNPKTNVSGILVSLDCTEEVIKEAKKRKCNLVVCHHPVIFKEIKSITGRNYVERTVMSAIKSDIAIYAIHTNLDNVSTGVNKKISDKIGLINTQILAPKNDNLSKLETFVPPKWRKKVLQAIHNAGAGRIGNYSECSFILSGSGTFLPNEKAKPKLGKKNQLETVEEERIEVIFPTELKRSIISALQYAHPYEEVAYYLHDLQNWNEDTGSGMIGDLPVPVSSGAFLLQLKKKFGLKVLRHTAFVKSKVRRIAVCGGAGSFLISRAKAVKADVFVTADIKYHEFFDAEGEILIVDIGHYESEVFTKDLLCTLLRKKFSNFAVNLSKTNTNPVNYL